MIFFHEQDSRFSPQIIPKVLFLIGIVQIKKYGLKTLFFLFRIIVSIPDLCNLTYFNKNILQKYSPSVTKLVHLHTTLVIHYTHHIKMALLIQGSGLSKCANTFFL